MSIFGISTGLPRTERTILSGAGATTVLNATGRSNYAVVGILLVNSSGGALTPIIDIYDGTTAFVIRDDTTLADQGREVVTLPDFLQLRRDDLMRVTANTGLRVFVSYIDNPASRSQTNG